MASIWGRPLLVGLAAGLAHAVLMVLAFEPLAVWPVGLVVVAPLAWAAAGLGRRAAAAGRGVPWRAVAGVWAGSLGWWAWAMHWTATVTAAGFVPLLMVVGGYTALGFWAMARVARGLAATAPASKPSRLEGAAMSIGMALAWGAVEVFRGRVLFDGYGWYYAGHGLIEAGPWLTWPGRVGGDVLVSVLAASVGAGVGVGMGVGVGVRRGGLIAAGVVGAAWAGGGALWPRGGDGAAEPVRLALVQTNVPQSVREGWPLERRLEDFERFIGLTREAAAGGGPGAEGPGAEGPGAEGSGWLVPDAIVWPETMFPGYVLERPDRDEFARALLEVQRRLGPSMVVGAMGFEGLEWPGADRAEEGPRWAGLHNSVFSIGGGAIRGRYDKVRLTPFGEVMPYISAWPWLERALLSIGARGMTFDLDAGRRAGPLELRLSDGRAVLAATPVCFEVTDAGAMRRLVVGDGIGGDVAGGEGDGVASVIINLTNDGWFGGFVAGRLHHAMVARWRCVELGRPMARAANTGVSTLIDRWGRVTASGVEGAAGWAGANVEGVLRGSIEPALGLTPYARWGWVVPWGVMWAGGVWAAWPGRVGRIGRGLAIGVRSVWAGVLGAMGLGSGGSGGRRDARG